MPKSITQLQIVLRPLLMPFAVCYSGLMRLRAALYRARIFSSFKPTAPCVSVGNIGWGGSGKTPLVSWLLSWATNKGLKPVVLTRGYHAHPQKYPYWVQAGAMAEEAGDEPLMLARAHPGAAVVVDPVRTRAGKWAQAKLSPDLYFLDDGFQHMAVGRDVNLVLLTLEDFLGGWDRVIPSGSWRESVDALARADAFLVKASPRLFREQAELIRARLLRFGKPVFSFSIKPQGIRSLRGGVVQPHLDHKRYLLVSGVGDPEQVEATVKGYLGYEPELHKIFKDHHFYTRAEVASLEMLAGQLGCEAIICTPKDAVKIGAMATTLFWTLDLDLAFGPSLGPGKPFDLWWNGYFAAMYRKRYDKVIGSRHGETQADETEPQEQ